VDATNYQTEAERRSTGGHGFNEADNKWHTGPQFTWQNTGWKPYDDTHPVVNVTWNDAQRFCKWLSQKEKTPYRLPTEAEWEYTCRAGTQTLFWNGDDPDNLPQIANVADATAKERFPDWPTAVKGRDGYIFTAPVGTYLANPWGLFDMQGNVAEFTADVYDANAYRNRVGTTTVDPYVTSGSDNRVHRGGHFYYRSTGVNIAARASNPPNTAADRVGFRVVSAVGP
jgi:formylglycine-generating enzyme required for sulfatase activity